ncbi:YjaG family protein [Motilimonas cestriensis]|uniref:YjaG family protein n=1 Tax=Motilimonas cestriensis TaxID=2742685 RepID=A0ABS8W861_9GAMM|nr:YjaG family protein [Motilimonas cestriensis]
MVKNINKQLNQFAPWQQVSFCIALAERMYPNYVLFCEGTEFQGQKTFRKMLDLFWEKLTVKGAKVNFEIQSEHFEAAIPNIEDYDMYGVYPALDACVVMTCAFNSMLVKQEDAEEAINASQTSIATVASFIEATSEEELTDEDIFADELMQQELAFQNELLELLDETRSPELLKAVRKFGRNEGISNIGISLD